MQYCVTELNMMKMAIAVSHASEKEPIHHLRLVR